MQPALEVINLKKRFGKLTAVDGISFAVPPGICFGLLGPNGAGKTTTIEMIEGIIKPTSGDILYKGEKLGPQFREEVGIMFQSTALQEFITVREVLEMFSKFYNKRIDIADLIKKCDLHDFLGQNNKRISGGQKQRLLMAVALINDPNIVFLDEPTTGLDPQARRNLWRMVQDIKAAGKTVILTTHYMEEAYRLSDQIAIMDKGRIIAHGTPDGLLKSHFSSSVIELPEADFTPTSPLSLTPHHIGGAVHITTAGVSETLHELLNKGVTLDRMKLRAQSLEDLFIELTGKEERE